MIVIVPLAFGPGGPYVKGVDLWAKPDGSQHPYADCTAQALDDALTFESTAEALEFIKKWGLFSCKVYSLGRTRKR
jgi:hypothetical protein